AVQARRKGVVNLRCPGGRGYLRLPRKIQLESVLRVGVFFFSSRSRHTRSVSAFLLNRSSDLQTFFLISWFSLLLLQLLRHLFYRHLKLHRQRYILIVRRLMLVMVDFFIAFRWIHLSTPLIRLFLCVLILILMLPLSFLRVWFA